MTLVTVLIRLIERAVEAAPAVSYPHPMRSVFFICLMSLALCGQAAIYKWVDSRGDVHYSDTPTRDSEEIKLSDPTIYTPTSTGSQSGSAATGTRPPEGINYSSFVILAPSNNEVVQANGGSITIRFQAQPGLQPGHYIQAVLDGRILDQRVTGATLQLSNVERGGHMVHASIHDAAGRLLVRSNIVQFFVRQVSLVEDGKTPVPPPSGSGSNGGDAPQYKPGDAPDYSGKPAANPGSDAGDYNSPRKPISSTPGQSNPAFKPNY
ncbi:DUF4124 domain-containing protein [Sedimenticola sp.]|uniref:DUF4124 domain-containing protein n=1 Tax=Sedimenticola sp. TaxID=1940285 RepID=UPI002586DA79|nr:DUF4124 domain-containing protein [Sedimenticola sp.]MCW8903897.1 DUF4124 domain-containing protein [Sedimenticola sp.]